MNCANFRVVTRCGSGEKYLNEVKKLIAALFRNSQFAFRNCYILIETIRSMASLMTASGYVRLMRKKPSPHWP